jgi:hypothetical protein
MSLLIPSPVEKGANAVIAAAVFLAKKWRWFVVFIAIVAVCWALGMLIRVFHRTPKLNIPEIQRAQKAIANEDREEMTRVLVESDVREKAIDANVAYANNQTVDAIAESRKTWQNASNAEMQAELERRAKESQ